MSERVEGLIADALRQHTPFDQFDIEIDPVGKCGPYRLYGAGDCDEVLHYENWFGHTAQQIVQYLHSNGIIGFIDQQAPRVPRVYSDEDAEAWVDTDLPAEPLHTNHERQEQ